MSDQTEPESTRRIHRRLDPFLDCVAYLLAKRWLRDQRQQEETQQEPPDPPAEQAEDQ